MRSRKELIKRIKAVEKEDSQNSQSSEEENLSDDTQQASANEEHTDGQEYSEEMIQNNQFTEQVCQDPTIVGLTEQIILEPYDRDLRKITADRYEELGDSDRAERERLVAGVYLEK